MTRPNACKNQRQGERCPFLLFGVDEAGLAPSDVVVVEFDPGVGVDDDVVVGAVVNERVRIALVVERCHELTRDREDREAIIRLCMDSMEARSKTCLLCYLCVWGVPTGSSYCDLLAALHKRPTY